eukprot:11255764-Alexandrium_andersonii.AAC.1
MVSMLSTAMRKSSKSSRFSAMLSTSVVSDQRGAVARAQVRARACSGLRVGKKWLRKRFCGCQSCLWRFLPAHVCPMR